MVRCGSKKGHQKDTCLKDIELHAQNMTTILDSIVNIIRREGEGGGRGRELNDHLMSTIIFNVIIIRYPYEHQKP